MKRTIILLFCSFCFLYLQAQTVFSPGYIVPNDGEIQYGMIYNNSYHKNALECKFKPNDSDTVILYTPSDIKAYRFTDGKYYVSHTVDVDKIEQQLFLEFIMEGALNIYFYQDKGLKNRYFVSKENYPIKELKYEEGTIYAESDESRAGQPVQETKYYQYAYEKKYYIGILTYFTSDTPQVQKYINAIRRPSHKSLIKFGKSYHKYVCDSVDCVVYEKNMSWKILLSPQTGVGKYSSSNDSYGKVGLEVLFQMKSLKEQFFVGIGVDRNISELAGEDSPVIIPFSINYIDLKQGFSPTVSIKMENFTPYHLQWEAGVKYQQRNISVRLTAGLRSTAFSPYAWGANASIMFPIK